MVKTTYLIGHSYPGGVMPVNDPKRKNFVALFDILGFRGSLS
jgi:hypothetical protein